MPMIDSCLSAIDHENGFYWTSTPNRIAKLCAQYELYKRIIPVAGAIIETGVFKASTLIRLATFRHFFETSVSRPIYAFDAFGKFPQEKLHVPVDIDYASSYDSNFGIGLSEVECMSILSRKGIEENIHLIAGDITETMPVFFAKHAFLQLAFVHVDVEAYEPTKAILQCCWPRLVTGGIMALDDFNGDTGAVEAIAEFFSGLPMCMVEKLNFSDAPAYVQKRQ